jgi:hypothetical protein
MSPEPFLSDQEENYYETAFASSFISSSPIVSPGNH